MHVDAAWAFFEVKFEKQEFPAQVVGVSAEADVVILIPLINQD